MEARYISSTYTTDIKDTLECNKWMTEKGAEGVSGYIAYAIFFSFFAKFTKKYKKKTSSFRLGLFFLLIYAFSCFVTLCSF